MEVLKQNRKPATLVYPVPAVMVSCGNKSEEYNIITIAWTGTINSLPPMCYISIRPERHSHGIIKKYMEFVINLTSKNLTYQTDFCGYKSGRKINKFEEMNLTPQKANIVGCPIIAESPVNIECKVERIIPLGSHDMFIAEIVNININNDLIDEKTGTLKIEKLDLVAYSNGFYHELGNIIGKSGFSVNNKI